MSVLLNPVCQYAVNVADTGRIAYIDGLWNPSHTLPFEGDVITRPFLVDPISRKPIPCRVVAIHYLDRATYTLIAVEVARADQDH